MDQPGCAECHRFLSVILPYLQRGSFLPSLVNHPCMCTQRLTPEAAVVVVGKAGKTFIYYAQDQRKVATIALDDDWSGLLIRPLPFHGGPTSATPLLASSSSSSSSASSSFFPAFLRAHFFSYSSSSSSYSLSNNNNKSSCSTLEMDNERIGLARFRCILDGHQTPTFHSYLPHPLLFIASTCLGGRFSENDTNEDCHGETARLPPAPSALCFSLLFGGGSLYGADVRTIDLQAEKPEDKEDFTEAILAFNQWRCSRAGKLFLAFRSERRRRLHLSGLGKNQTVELPNAAT